MKKLLIALSCALAVTSISAQALTTEQQEVAYNVGEITFCQDFFFAQGTEESKVKSIKASETAVVKSEKEFKAFSTDAEAKEFKDIVAKGYAALRKESEQTNHKVQVLCDEKLK